MGILWLNVSSSCGMSALPPAACVWVNSRVACVALSWPLAPPANEGDAWLSAGPWEPWVSTNMGVITVLLRRQFESIT